MNTRKITLCAILLALGLAFHLMPSFSFAGMKMDFLLSMMFIALMSADNFGEVMTMAIAFGLASAMTTSLPGGQLPNMIDKLVTASVVYGFLKLTKSMGNKVLRFIMIAVMGTAVSGFVFVLSAIILTDLSLSMPILMMTVVLPATAGNALLLGILASVIDRSPLKSIVN